MNRIPSVIAVAVPVALLGTLSLAPLDPCSPEEIARLKAEYREKAQQLEDLENAKPLVDQLTEIRSYLDVLNEAAGETKSDIEDFVEDNEKLLDNLKTEVRTQNQNTQSWARSVYQNDAWEQNTSTAAREVSVTEGLNVTAEKLGELEDLTGDVSDVLSALEQGMRAQSSSEQLKAFQNYFDTMTGFLNNDEMKAAFPVLHVFAPWFEYFSKAMEFAAFMTESIEESAAMREKMLADALAAGTDDFFSDWAIDYSPPTKTPYEILEEQREKLEAELDEIEQKLADCDETPPGRPTTGGDVDPWATERADFEGLRTLCFRRLGLDGETTERERVEALEAKARVEPLAFQLWSRHDRLRQLQVDRRVKTRERADWEGRRRDVNPGQREDAIKRLTGELDALDEEEADLREEIERLEEQLQEALAAYETKRERVEALKACIVQEYLLLASRGDVQISKLSDLPDEYQYRQFKNCNYWELSGPTQQAIRETRPDPPATGGATPESGAGRPTGEGGEAAGAPTGAGGAGEPGGAPGEDSGDDAIPPPEQAGAVSAPGAAGAGVGAGAGPVTGGAAVGAVLGAGTGIPLTEEVEPIDFEIEPDTDDEPDDAIPPSALPPQDAVPTQGSDRPVTGDAPGAPAPEGVSYIDPAASAPLLNSPITAGSVDPTTQQMMLDLMDLELGTVEAFVPMGEDDRSALQGHGGGMYLAVDGSGGAALLVAATERTDEPKVTAFLTSLGVSTGEAFDLVALNEGDLPVRISGDGIVVEPVQLKDEAKRQLQSKLNELAGRNPVTAKLNAYCLEFLARPPTAGQLFRIASSEIQEQFAPMRNILKAGRGVFENGLLNPDSDPVSYMHSIKQWALWSHEKGFDLDSFTDAFLEHTRKNFEAADREWTGQIEEAVRAVLPNRWNDIQQVLRAAGEIPGSAD